MKQIITLGGSNSKTSISKTLSEYAGQLLKENYKVINIDLNDYEMPLYSVDVEAAQGFPKSTLALNDLFNTADGFIVTLAEHNGVYSAVFKNTLDWLSRINGKVWRAKPMLLMSSSPGGRGGATVLEIAKNRFPFHDAKITGSMSFPLFYDNFKNGAIVNDNLKSNLLVLLDDFKKAV